MLKMRELQDVPVLFDLMIHPEVFPYVRLKANTIDEYYFHTKTSMEAECRAELISRTILDEYNLPIGVITLYDIQENYGFLSTWIGRPYFGKGYNRLAKEAFFDEVFHHLGVDGIFMKVKKTNFRSTKAVLKLPYVTAGNDVYPEIYQNINNQDVLYNLFAVTKEHYFSYRQFAGNKAVSTDEEVV
jgi:RimJ/RimL family protein N-acetyltransferase